MHMTNAMCSLLCVDGFGQRALVGKVNMDMESPEFYVEKNMETSVQETRRYMTLPKIWHC